MVSQNDWRRQGQERYLKGQHLTLKKYTKYSEDWEHDHCEFCNTKFMEGTGDLPEGWVTDDNYHWICMQCYKDFCDEYEWN
jgi:hypothetical protein